MIIFLLVLLFSEGFPFTNICKTAYVYSKGLSSNSRLLIMLGGIAIVSYSH